MKPMLEKIQKPVKSVQPLLKEFREFAARGNVLDLAVGVIIGAAFGKVVDALVTHVLMPPLGLLTGGIDLSHRFINLGTTYYATLEEATKNHATVISYGVFLDAIFSFFIVSFSIFMLVRVINKLHQRPPPPAPPPPAPTRECPFCISTIPLRATRCPRCTSQLAALSP
jgi:large conductance mechanosensitive channel